ncbi:MAG: Trp biosynthesis-associated membrane protein [Lacisediminihabitans sp.]
MTVSARRLKSSTLLAIVVVSGLTLLAWTQIWFTVTVSGTDTATPSLSVAGSVAAPALSALSLAGLALVAALAISGPVLRMLFGVLEMALGAGVAVSSLLAIGSPVAASASAVTKATGLSGEASVAHLVTSVGQSAWPWVAVALGVLSALLGLIVLVTTRRWPGSTGRYQAMNPTERRDSRNRVSDWDELSGGSDPTSR